MGQSLPSVTFDFRTFLRLKLYEARRRAAAPAWLLSAAQLVVYPMVHLCFALDELLHPEIAHVPVQRPVFIVGFPRSGTTLLFHLLAADPAVATYDLYRMICPSVTLRRLIPALVKDRFIRGLESRVASLDGIHPIRAEQPEEDEILFLLLGNSGINSYVFPYSELARRCQLNRFWEWPDERRNAYLRFYHRSLQRLLWDTGRSRYVGKSPHFLGKVDDLHRQYPDALFVYPVRSPYECVPSALSMITTMWKIAAPGPLPSSSVQHLYEDLVALWVHGDACLQALPAENKLVVSYDEIVRDPRHVVHRVYAQLGCAVPDGLDAVLRLATDRQSQWRSSHRYALRDFGIDRDRVQRDLEPLFLRHVS